MAKNDDDLFKKLYGKDATRESVQKMYGGYSQKALSDLKAGTYSQNRVPSLNSSNNATNTSTPSNTTRRFGRSAFDYDGGVVGSELNSSQTPSTQVSTTQPVTDYLDRMDKVTLNKWEKDHGRMIGSIPEREADIKKFTEMAAKYGKTYDEFINDFHSVQSDDFARVGEKLPILAGISELVAGAPNKSVSGLFSAVANAINPESDYSKELEASRYRTNRNSDLQMEGIKRNTGDIGDQLIDVAQALGDRTSVTLLGKALGGYNPMVGKVASGVLAGGLDANNMMNVYDDRGADKKDSARAALVHGGVEGLGTAITSGIFDKKLASSMLGEFAKAMGNAVFEQAVSQLVEDTSESLTLRDKSMLVLAYNNAREQGKSHKEAIVSAGLELAKSSGSAAFRGAFFGALLKASGMGLSKALGNVFGNGKAKVPTIDTSNMDPELAKYLTDDGFGVRTENKLPGSVEDVFGANEIKNNSKIPSMEDVIDSVNNPKADAQNVINDSALELPLLKNDKVSADPSQKLKQIGRHTYATDDGKYEVSKFDGKYYAFDVEAKTTEEFDSMKQAKEYIANGYKSSAEKANAQGKSLAPINKVPTVEDYNNILNNITGNKYGALTTDAPDFEPVKLNDATNKVPTLAEQVAEVEPTKLPTAEPKIEEPNGQLSFDMEQKPVTTDAPIDKAKLANKAFQISQTGKGNNKLEALSLLLGDGEISKRDITAIRKLTDADIESIGITRKDLNNIVADYDAKNGTTISKGMPAEQLEFDFEKKNTTTEPEVKPIDNANETPEQMEFNIDEQKAPTEQSEVPKQNNPVNVLADTVPEQKLTGANGNLNTADADGTEYGYSKFVSNSSVNADIIKKANLTDPDVMEVAKYAIKHEEASMQKALQNYAENAEGFEKAFASGQKQIVDPSDVDTAMLIMTKLGEQEATARKNGDLALAKQLHDRKISMQFVTRKEGTKNAQFLQALAKWNRTAEGAEMNARALKSQVSDEWANKNGQYRTKIDDFVKDVINNDKVKNGNKQLQRTLDSIVEPEAEAKPNTQLMTTIKDQVVATLDKEGASFKNKFSDEDVDFIANMIQRGVSDDELKDAITNKLATGTFGISDDAVQKVNSYFEQAKQYNYNSKQRCELEAEAYKVLANEVYGNSRSALETYDAWRYLAMLGNPRTHMRNILGNTTHFVVTETKDNLAAALESVVDKTSKAFGGNGIERTKAVLTPKDNALVKRSAIDAEEGVYTILNGQGRYDNVKQGIMANRKAFGSKTKVGEVMNAINDFNSNALDKEDFFGLKNKYSKSLARYLKANGADESIFDSTKTSDIELLEKARSFAIDEAQQATFHEASQLADLLNETSKKLRTNTDTNGLYRNGKKALGYAIEGVVPFKKTPINILKQGIKYSPVSAVQAVGDIVSNLVKMSSGKGTLKSASGIIDEAASGVVGSGIFALGYWLSKNGFLKSSLGNDYDKKSQLEREGQQEYSLYYNGKSYTIDWLSPISIPLFVGAELANLNNDETDDNYFNKAVNMFSSVANPVVEMSMLQGIQNTLSSIRNGNKTGIGTAVAGTLAGYFTQGVPTLAGQIARSVDDTRRSTYSGKTGASELIDKGFNKIINKTVPALNEPYVDAEGNTEENVGGNFLGRMAYNMLSPGYYKEGRVGDPTDMELDRLNEATGEKLYPTVSNGSVTVNGKSTKMAPEAFTEYQKMFGQVTRSTQELIPQVENYNYLDDSKKAEALHEAKTLAGKFANAEVNGDILSESEQKEYEIYKQGGEQGLANYIVDKNLANQIGVKYNKFQELGYDNSVQYAQDSQEAKALGLSTKKYQDVQSNYEGGASQFYADEQEANSYGYSGDNAIENMNNAKNIFGNSVPELKEYANYSQNWGNSSRDERYSEITRYNWTPEQKARAMFKDDSESLTGQNQFFFDEGGWDGVWEYQELMRKLDGTGKNGNKNYKIDIGEWNKYKSSNELTAIEQMFDAYLNKNK